MKCLTWIALTMSVAALSACTANGDEEEILPTNPDADPVVIRNSSSSSLVDESSESSSGDSAEISISTYLKVVDIPAMSFSRSTASYEISPFSISVTEVTQGVYRQVMGSLPKQTENNDSLPVANVNWYEAALFCNSLSRLLNLDTAYVYDSVEKNGSFVNLVVNYSAKTVRLPTEMEWEVAARGGTSSVYYWGTDVASDYAYYGQSKGPVAVAQYKPNSYGLYDVGGNVAEWTGDWYDSYPTTAQKNYHGPETGSAKVVRGGGWADKVTALSPSERDKKDALYSQKTIGFRIVQSDGI